MDTYTLASYFLYTLSFILVIVGFRVLLKRDKRFKKGFKYKYNLKALTFFIIAIISFLLGIFLNGLGNV
jgi:hypothetical protein